MVVLESNQRDASIIVLLSILGEDSSVLVQGTLQSAGGNDDKRSIMASENASYFRNFAAELSDRQSLLFLRTISQSLLDALSSCDHGALLAVFNDIFCKVSETYRVDPWSKIYYMDSIASVLKEVCRQMANAASDDTLFGGMPRGLEEHALRIVFDNLDDEEVIVIRSAQILLQDVLSVDEIRPSAHGGPGIMMKQALHFCSSLSTLLVHECDGNLDANLTLVLGKLQIVIKSRNTGYCIAWKSMSPLAKFCKRIQSSFKTQYKLLLRTEQ